MKANRLDEPLTSKMTDAHKATSKKSIAVYKVILTVAVIGAVVIFFTMGFDSYFSFQSLRDNREQMIDLYQDHYLATVALFILTYTLVVALSLPGAIWMTLAGGFVFGTLQATVYVVISATLGASIVFVLAKFCLVDFFQKKIGAAIEKMGTGLKSNAFSYLLFLRLVPVFPFWLVNLVPAFLGVPFQTFVFATALGIIPGTAVFCWVGNGLGLVLDAEDKLNPLEVLLRPEIFSLIFSLGVLSLIPIVYKKFKNNSS